MQKTETPSQDKTLNDASNTTVAVTSTPQNTNGTAATPVVHSGRGKRGGGRGGLNRAGPANKGNQSNNRGNQNGGRFNRNNNQAGQAVVEKKWEENNTGNGTAKLSEVRTL